MARNCRQCSESIWPPRRDETSPRFNENVSGHRRGTPARNDKWNFQISLSRADCRRDRIMQRLEIIGPPPPSGRATCPRYPPFRISFGRDRQSSPLFAPCLGIVRAITINYIRCIDIDCSAIYPRSIGVYEAKIDIKKRKGID